ncbi:VanZ family protein [Rhodococcus sp. NPDC003322]
MLAKLGSRRAIPFFVVLVITLVMLFSPGSTVPSGPPNSDKVTHLLMFLALAVAARYAGFRAGWVLLGGALYAAVSEALQALLPIHRSGSIWDWLADVVGVAVGLALVWWVAHRRRSGGARSGREESQQATEIE